MPHINIFRRGQILAFVLILTVVFGPILSAAAQADSTWLLSPIPGGKKCSSAADWGEYNPAGNQKFHNAWDFCGGGRGSPVVAVADCQVVYADWWQKDYQSLNLGHGWTVGCWHPKNHIYTYYTHLQEIKVSVGQQVKKEETVGLEGDSGKALGVHTHFVTAIMEPQRMVTAKNCPQPYCFPNPDAFLGQDTVAESLGLTTISPSGEVFKPAPGVPLYTGGKPIDESYFQFVETAMSTKLPAPVVIGEVTPPSTIEFDFEEFTEEPTPISTENTTVTASQPNSKWEQPLKWLFIGLVLFFIFACIFSADFRRGAIPVVLITVLVLVMAAIFLILTMP